MGERDSKPLPFPSVGCGPTLNKPIRAKGENMSVKVFGRKRYYRATLWAAKVDGMLRYSSDRWVVTWV
jgi:hypothetical protein